MSDQFRGVSALQATALQILQHKVDALSTQIAVLEARLRSSTPVMYLKDGVPTPDTIVGAAIVYVDTADGDLKIRFGDGTIKTIVTDT